MNILLQNLSFFWAGTTDRKIPLDGRDRVVILLVKTGLTFLSSFVVSAIVLLPGLVLAVGILFAISRNKQQPQPPEQHIGTDTIMNDTM